MVTRPGPEDFSIFEGHFAAILDNMAKKCPSKGEKKAQKAGHFNFGITSKVRPTSPPPRHVEIRISYMQNAVVIKWFRLHFKAFFDSFRIAGKEMN